MKKSMFAVFVIMVIIVFQAPLVPNESLRTSTPSEPSATAAAPPDKTKDTPYAPGGIDMASIEKQDFEVRLTNFVRGAMDPVLKQMADGSVWLVGHYAQDWQPFYTISRDGGRTWSSPVLLWKHWCYDFDLAQGADGRIWVAWTATVPDPYDPVYRTTTDAGQTWSDVRKLSVPPDNGAVMSIVPVSANQTWLCWEGFRIASADGGQTWGTVRSMPSFGWANATYSSTRDGRIWVVTVFRGIQVQLQWSSDNGRTWSSPLKVATVEPAPPKPREHIRPVARLFEDSEGQLWLAWYAYSSSTKSSQVWLTKSTNAGADWSPPTQITTDPSFHGSYFSSVSLAEVNGNIWVVYASNKSGKWQIYRTIVGRTQLEYTKNNFSYTILYGTTSQKIPCAVRGEYKALVEGTPYVNQSFNLKVELSINPVEAEGIYRDHPKFSGRGVLLAAVDDSVGYVNSSKITLKITCKTGEKEEEIDYTPLDPCDPSFLIRDLLWWGISWIFPIPIPDFSCQRENVIYAQDLDEVINVIGLSKDPSPSFKDERIYDIGKMIWEDLDRDRSLLRKFIHPGKLSFTIPMIYSQAGNHTIKIYILFQDAAFADYYMQSGHGKTRYAALEFEKVINIQ